MVKQRWPRAKAAMKKALKTLKLLAPFAVMVTTVSKLLMVILL